MLAAENVESISCKDRMALEGGPVHALGMWARAPFYATSAFLLLASGWCSGEELRKFEIRRASSADPGMLVAFVGERQVNLTTSATKAWTGWHPNILLYSERRADARYDLQVFNAITGGRKVLTTEQLPVEDLTVARLESGEYTLVLFLGREAQRELALAHPESGVFRRIPNAETVAIVDDKIEVRRGRSTDRIPLSREASASK